MELFTALQMGRKADSISLVLIGGESFGSTSLDAVRASFREFKGERAECFKRDDKERLLAVVEGAFGDFKTFNAIVRGVFEARQRPSLAKLSTAGSLGASRSQLSVPESSSERPSIVSPSTPHVLSSRTEPSASASGSATELAAVEVRVV